MTRLKRSKAGTANPIHHAYAPERISKTAWMLDGYQAWQLGDRRGNALNKPHRSISPTKIISCDGVTNVAISIRSLLFALKQPICSDRGDRQRRANSERLVDSALVFANSGVRRDPRHRGISFKPPPKSRRDVRAAGSGQATEYLSQRDGEKFNKFRHRPPPSTSVRRDPLNIDFRRSSRHVPVLRFKPLVLALIKSAKR
jgi:hypothetical protein